MPMSDILDRLADLHKQATEERSHYYVGGCVRDAIDEIKRLRRTVSWLNAVVKESGAEQLRAREAQQR